MEEDELCFPQLNNSCRRIKVSQLETVFTHVLLGAFSVLTVTLNLLVIISISHFRQLHTPTNLLLCSLAFSDLIGGLVTINEMLLMGGCWYLGDHMCIFHFALTMLIGSSSVGNIVLISIDRYMAICYPLHYPIAVTSSRVRLFVLLCWSCCFIYVGAILRNNIKHLGKYNSCIGECVVFLTFHEKVTDLIITFAVPILVIIILYGKVLIAALSHVRAARSQPPVASLQLSVKVTVKKSELKAARSLGVVVVTFLSCLCPFYCVMLASQVNFQISGSIIFVTFLLYLNCCLDPLIYVYVFPWFRKALKLTISLQILKSGSSYVSLK